MAEVVEGEVLTAGGVGEEDFSAEDSADLQEASMEDSAVEELRNEDFVALRAVISVTPISATIDPAAEATSTEIPPRGTKSIDDKNKISGRKLTLM